MGMASSDCLSQQILVFDLSLFNPSGCTQKNKEPKKRPPSARQIAPCHRPARAERSPMPSRSAEPPELSGFGRLAQRPWQRPCHMRRHASIASEEPPFTFIIELLYIWTLDTRASRRSGPVRREPDGARAAELDAGNAGSGGTGGANHPGRHRNASGGVEFPPSAVPRFCRRDIPEVSDD